MTTPLTVALAEMRRQFADQLSARVAAIRAQFAHIDLADWQVDRVEALHRLVHGLTGSAGTFGMNSISDAARGLEQHLIKVLATPTAPPATTWAHGAALLDHLEKLAAVRLQSNAPSLAPLPVPRLHPGGPPLIHLVEDDADQAAGLGQALKAHGYPVHAFSSIADFQAAYADGDVPAAIVMDMIFADDKDAGAKAIAALMADDTACPPVVFVSVRDDLAARLGAYRAGASRYFSKPVDPIRLNRVLDELTGRMPPEAWRVLLVDDDPLLLDAQAAVLRQSGMNVKTVSAPLAALDAVREFAPDVVVLDVYMPDANGPELAAVLREQDAYAHLPILFLSAEADMSRQLLALNLGGDDFLVKPVQPAHLVAAVAARARRARKNLGMMSSLKTLLYEREREHLALNQHAIVSIADRAGNITYANEKFCAVSGYAAEELIGQNHRLLKSGRHPAAFYEDLWRTIASGNVWQGEICNRRKDGSLYWVESTITPFLDGDGKPYQFVSIRTEITSLRQTMLALAKARDAAESANRAKSEFLSSMSHELRTPMNAVLGFAQLLDFDEALADNHREEVHEILKAGRHLLELINEVLDLAKIEAGHIALTPEAVELDELVAECIRLMQPLAATRHITLATEPWASTVIHCDRTRLRQVLLNLLSNAIKYNRDEGSVHIGVGPAGANADFVRLEVRDTGYGIPNAQMGELFQPFHRLANHEKTIEGTGIGLAISRRLVELMGGTVGAESSVGVGSAFWCELPLAPACAEAPARLATAPAAAQHDTLAAAPRRVLYIEDNPANMVLVARILARRGDIELMAAPSARLGLDLAAADPPALILLDITLPDMDGYAVLAALKANASLASIPVIALTANAMTTDIERGLQAGFVAYLTKPLNVELFAEAVSHWLEQPTA